MHNTIALTNLNANGLLLALCLSLLLAASCSSGGAELPTAQHSTAAGHELKVLDDSFVDGGSARFEVAEKALAGGGLELTVSARDASALKALYFELSFDSKRYVCAGVTASPALAGNSDAPLLQLTHCAVPGQLVHGQLLARFETQAGLSGDALLATVHLRPTASAPAAAVVRQSSAITDSAFAPRLRFDPELRELNWSYSAGGDYDQNGIVSISDLTPLGQHFGEKQSSGFGYESALSVVDGDGNSEIGISDITPIGAHFAARVDGYRVYACPREQAEANYPVEGSLPTGLEPIGWLPLHASIENSAERRRYSLSVATQEFGQVYWLRPVGDGIEGCPSNRSDRGFAGHSEPQILYASQGTSGDTPLQLFINASSSTDPDGEIVAWAFARDDAPAVQLQPQPLYNEQLGFASYARYYIYAVDDDGICAMSPALPVSATLAGNHVPELSANFPAGVNGEAPFNMIIDLSDSSDADGDLLAYSLKVIAYGSDGNLLYEAAGVEPLFNYSFSEAGNYLLRYSAIQQDGLADYGIQVIRVLEGGNALPFAEFFPDKQMLNTGELLHFARTAGCIDSDGEIVLYEIDPEGSGNWIEYDLAAHDFIYAYSEAGSYAARLRVTDDDGGVGFSSPVLVSVLGNPGTAPQAELSVTPPAGIAPLTVLLDASASSDANGIVLEYFFDLADGIGFVSNGNDPSLEHVFPLGSHEVKLRVVDNQGLSAEVGAVVQAVFPL